MCSGGKENGARMGLGVELPLQIRLVGKGPAS